MGIRVNLYSGLQDYTGGQNVVTASGRTIGECIKDVIRQFPVISRILLDEKGELLNHVFISINLKSAYPEELTAPVKADDELHIALIIAGG